MIYNFKSNYASHLPVLLIVIIGIFSVAEVTFCKDSEFITDEFYVQFSEKLSVNKSGRYQLGQHLESLFSSTPVSDIRAVFPETSPDKRLSGMDRVYRIKIKNAANILKTIQRLEESDSQRMPCHREGVQ